MATHSMPLDAGTRTALMTGQSIDIITQGARTGRDRRTEIWYFVVAGQVIITGTPGPRDWYRNLLINPAFRFCLKERLVVELPALAAPIVEHTEREQVFMDAATDWYRQRCPVTELIASAPLIRVGFL